MRFLQKPLNTYLRIFFVAILLFSVYHFARDVLQTFNLDSVFTNIGHRTHQWCGAYCDLVTWPLDIAGIAISIIVLIRNHIGILGAILLASLPLWVIFTLLP